MREYEKSHPWLTFELNLQNAPANIWILLGEAQSKCQHLADIPLKPDTAKWLHQVFLAKGALATTAIEGNTLTEQEVLDHLAGKLKLPESRQYLAREIDNIIEAFNSVLKKIIEKESIELSLELFSFFNKTVLSGLRLSDPKIKPGSIRVYDVGVGRYKGAPYQDCEYLMDRLCDWLNSEARFTKNSRDPIVYGLLRAIIAHVYFVWVHPFGDGNGRTARLIETSILMSIGVPSTAAHLLSNYYNQTREVYYGKLQEVSNNGGNLIPFIEYAVFGFVEQLREHIQIVKVQQIHVAWINFIHEIFQDKQKTVDRRRRELIIGISNSDDSHITEDRVRNLDPQVATIYAAVKSDRTIKTDLEALRKLELLVKDKNGYRLNIRKIMGFKPVTSQEVDEELSDALFSSARQLKLL